MILFYIIILILYIIFGIITFGIGYKYNFLDIRQDYIDSLKHNDEYSTIVAIIIFWPLIAVCILLFSIPLRIVNIITTSVDRDLANNESNDKNIEL